MSKRKIYYVSPIKDGGWKVHRKGASGIESTHRTKDAAVKLGRTLARSEPLGQLMIKKKNGKFQTEYTYGKDPYPPKG